MKRILSVCIVLVWAMVAFAQESKIPQRLELAEVEINDGELDLEVFNMPDEWGNHYYLSVGHLGIGDDVIQFQVDPLFELFIPLGETLDEAMAQLLKLQDLFKQTPGTSFDVIGNLALAFPNDKLEPVRVTYRKVLLSRMLEFSIEREGYIRATHISRMDFNSIISSMKLYRKIHPKEL